MASFPFEPLTPANFVRRSAAVFPDRIAVVDGERQWTYRQFAARCDAVRGILTTLGVGAGDRVAALCVNSHIMLELHQAVPAHAAVLVPINIRLAPDEIVFILEHSGA